MTGAQPSVTGEGPATATGPPGPMMPAPAGKPGGTARKPICCPRAAASAAICCCIAMFACAAGPKATQDNTHLK